MSCAQQNLEEDEGETFFTEDTCGPDSRGSCPFPLSGQAPEEEEERKEEEEEEEEPIEKWMILVGKEEEREEEEPIEVWMILGGEEEGDSNIQLNLGCWSSSEDDSGDEDPSVKSVQDVWAISEKDKTSTDHSASSRYFAARSLICQICNRTGHLAKSCYYHKKSPTCILCGVKGHTQKDCPSRPCPNCGLPSHGLAPCENPPLRNQHCQRCGMTGHLCDACPDTWRQYHLTIRLEVPLRPRIVHRLKHKRHLADCYNCSKRGHYGYECRKSRMASRTFPSLPYVCRYDTIDDILQCRRAKELVSIGSKGTSGQQPLSELTGESGEENQPIQGKNRTKQDTCRRDGRRKTWPERRRERQEIKRLRREAQARREGGHLRRSRRNSDDEACHAYPLISHLHGQRQSASPPLKKRRDEVCGRRSRKSREAERWKKRGGIKRGDLYPHGNIDIGSENLLSPKQRVRHRRR